MKHSNKFYTIGISNGDKIFTEVNAKKYKNNYGLDLFTFSDKYGVNISEGKTGLKIYTGIPSNFDNVINNLGGIDNLKKNIECHIEKYGLTPRYTESQNMKSKKQKDPNKVLSKYLYSKTKAYFICYYKENGIELYRKMNDKDNNYYTVYTSCNGWMIPLGSNGSTEVIINTLSDKDFSVHNWLVESFEKQMANAETWADLGIAEYLNKLDEAREHNEPIKANREAELEEEQRIKEAEEKAYIDEQNSKYEKAISDAENNIRNKLSVKNTEITLYKSRFDYSEKSLMLTLFKQYNIDVPLKTQGWINKALVEIIFDNNGNVTYRYFKDSKNSTVFRTYLSQLVNTISNNVTTEV